jgi:hypothetical protein
MRRAIIGVVLATFVVGMFASAVESQRRRQPPRGQRGARGKAKVAKNVEAPRSAAIGPALGDLRWGMTRDEVYNHFVNKIREDYRPRLAKATGAIEEDRLRAELNDKVRAIRDSYVRFDGRATGWDVSFLRDEYTHRNSEAMLAINDENSQNFYFFINGRLWKWFKAFNADVFAGQTFDQFAQAVQTRFGQARERNGALIEGGDERHWLEWQDDTSRLRAIDLTRFYGFYCLVFEEKATVGRLAELRVNRPSKNTKQHALVEAVLAGEGGSPPDDTNADIADRLTGKIRRRQDAPENAQGTGAGATKTTKGRTGTGTGTGTATPRPVDDDPLSGMDF